MKTEADVITSKLHVRANLILQNATFKTHSFRFHSIIFQLPRILISRLHVVTEFSCEQMLR
jgi:hypothetical protein